MLMQLIGAMAVVGGAAALGFYYAALETQRTLDLLEFKKALLILSSEIEYMRTPLPAAAVNIGKRVQRWVEPMFTRFGELLAQGEGETAYRLWMQAIGEVKEQTRLSEEDWAVVEGFGKTLGYLDKEMQRNAIEYTLSYIDEKAVALQTQADKNKKMYRSLGVVGGLLLVVVLW
ncbi:MAG: stage III sporulation protein AB [Defluviitaleaceae bacterium]|nr:stage III sporulation protein AB [Defluviitaleaceae bacterium]MCL2239026.1 stage III sporulation protein AB [Defluviitaleaceae bacterium]